MNCDAAHADLKLARLLDWISGAVAEDSRNTGEEMTITPEMEAEILRLYQAEGWRRGTIARQMGIHHGCVLRVLQRQGVAVAIKQNRKAKVDSYLPFIKETLEKYPKLNATRLHHMVKERGYTGGVDHFRDLIRDLRPVPRGEAYLRLSTLPGEQAQVDWGSFGKIRVGTAEHRLLAFVMVLSWSRRIFLRYYLGDDTACFLRGHVAAFEHFGFVPREILYDNLKTAVVERVGSAIRFNTELLRLAAHYRFSPKPVPVARPTSKGRVERAIQYIRTSFFAARQFTDVDDLNMQALAWCVEEAQTRPCPSNKLLTVTDAFEQEKESMLALPQTEYPIFERKAVQIGKTPYARFQGNDYSVPHNYVRKQLLVQATVDRVQIVDGVQVIAEHGRSYDKGALIEDSSHINELMAVKLRSNQKHGGMHRVLNVVPSSKDFFKAAAERGHNMGRLTQLLLNLLDLYGSSELELAMHECLVVGSVHSEAVRKFLEKRREARGLPPPIAMTFLKQASDLVDVTPKSLDIYDKLLNMEEDEE